MASSSESSLFNIEKLDGTNFPFWKEQIYNVLVQKKQVRPIKLKGIKPEGISDVDWQDLDELARSTIMLTLSKSVYFNVKEATTSFELWQKLCDLYEKKSAASQVYWLKQLVDLKMKEGTTMSNHLNEFNTIFSQLSSQEIKFDDSVKAIFLLVTLPESWDTFRTAISNSAPWSLAIIDILDKNFFLANSFQSTHKLVKLHIKMLIAGFEAFVQVPKFAKHCRIC